jgi:hypothetical protein
LFSDPKPVTIARPATGADCRRLPALLRTGRRDAASQGHSCPGALRFRRLKRGTFEDHWVVEVWDGARWKLFDMQLDALQQEALKLDFDLGTCRAIVSSSRVMRGSNVARRERPEEIRHLRSARTVVHRRQCRARRRRTQQHGDAALRIAGAPPRNPTTPGRRRPWRS